MFRVIRCVKSSHADLRDCFSIFAVLLVYFDNGSAKYTLNHKKIHYCLLNK